jgi:hypothetical protein
LAALLLSAQLYSEQYAITSKGSSSSRIKYLQIYSERCSGSNYLCALLSNNLTLDNGDNLKIRNYFHKHFPPWMDLASEQQKVDEKYYNFQDTEDHLFIFLFRDPYDWIRSFAATPWMCDRSLRKMPFSTFIRSTWVIDNKSDLVGDLSKRIACLEKNPIDDSWFLNPILLRNAKTINFFKIGEKVINAYFLRYEAIRDHPQEVLDEIAEIYNLRRKEEFSPVLYYKNVKNQGVYKKKKYTEISPKDLEYINSFLDKDLEAFLGYIEKNE